MNKIALSNAAISARPKLRWHCFSAGLGLACSLTTNPASAHDASQHVGVFGGSPATLTPHSISSSGSSGRSGVWTSFPEHGATQVSGNSLSAGKAYTGTAPRSQRAIFTLPESPESLDLGSNQSNLSLSGLGKVQTLTISVGGKSEVVNLSTKLTGAELLAADQVLSGGHQTLTINASGEATGGVFTLSSQSLTAIDTSLGGLNALSVPHNVRIVDTLSSLQLPGDLINSGHIIIQTNAGNTSTIRAYDIINATGASITSSSQPGSGANLSLVADDQLVNNGLISAGHTLTITTPSVVNTGMLKATRGDLDFSNNTSATINNAAGTISALQGNINVNTAAADGNIDINGGNLLSNQLNMTAGTGDVNVNVGNLTGVVNVDACSAHINATTADLQLGTMNVSGDPTYYNQGNITITGAMAPTGGAALAIIASGNIISNGGSLNTSASTLAPGGALLLVAGANFTTDDNSTSGNNNSTTTLTVTNGPGSGGGSITGGLIDLSGGHGGKAPITAITTSGAGLANSAGSVTMLAFAGKGASSGTVTLPQTFTLSTAGSLGKGGDVTIIAGATKGTAISVGNIDTSQGLFGQGNIQLAAAVPPITGPLTIQDGAIQTGSFSGIFSPTGGSITAGNLTTGGGDVNISCGGTLTFNNIDTSGKGGTAFAGGTGNNGANAGVVIVQAFGNVTGNNIFAYGGGGGGGSVNGNSGTDGGMGGNGGQVLLGSSQGTITIKGMIDTSGGGGGGGGGTGYSGAPGAAGNGGMGGTANDVTINSLKSCTVTGGIFSADGAFGGGGGLLDASNDAGSGGGGGASYGGGGGGGAAGNTSLINGGAGGGGGGGLYGGGGGSGAVPGFTANLGGNGGGFQTPGAGGTGSAGGPTLDNGLDGTKLSGGSGAGASVVTSTGLGGSLGFGGLGGGGIGSPLTNGSNGTNVVVANALSGGTLTITTSSGTVGTQKAPLTTLVQTLDLATKIAGKILTNAFYINNGADLITNFEAFGAVSIKAEGDITLVGPGPNIAGTTLFLTTAPGNVAGSGNININSQLETSTATLQAGGAGTIQTMAGQHLLANNLTLVSGSGAIGNFANPLSLEGLEGKVSANTNGAIFLTSQFSVTLDQSSSGQNSVNVACNGEITVAGAVTAPSGSVLLSSAGGIMLEANVSAPMGAVALIATGSANIVEKNISINTPTVFFGVDAGTIGTAKTPFKTDAAVANVDCNVTGNDTDVYITDTNTGMTSVTNQGNPGFLFNIISSASQLSVKAGQFAVFNISNVNKTGSIVFTGSSGDDGDSSITTIGGSVTQTAGALDAFSLNVKSASGSFGTAAAPIALNDPNQTNLTISTGNNATASFTQNTARLNLKASTAGTIILGTSTMPDMQTTIQGAVKATTSVLITDNGTALTQQSGATITANSVVLTNNSGNVVSDAAIKASAVTLDSTAGNVLFSSQIGLGTGAVQLTAPAGAVAQSNKAGLLSGSSVSLNAIAIGGVLAVDAATPSLTLITSTGDALVNVTGNTALQPTTNIGGNLTLTATGTITEASQAMITAGGNISIRAKSFTQIGGANPASLGAVGVLSITTSGMGNAIDIDGLGIIGLAALTVTTASKATITVASSAIVFSPDLTIQTGTLTNSGIIKTNVAAATPSGTLTITNPTSNLLISNSGTIGKPLDLGLSSGGNLTILDTSNGIVPFQTMSANSITITAKGALSLPNLASNSLLVAPDATNNGGTIMISAGSIIYPQGGLSFDTSAPSASMGNGGLISITITGKQNLILDASSGWGFQTEGGQNGGDGGLVSISTGGAIFVNQSGGAIDNKAHMAGFAGGAIELSAGSNLAISGILDSSFQNPGVIPGSVTLTSNGKTPFLVDQSVTFNSQSNGVSGIAGSAVSITNLAGVNIDTGSTLTTNNSLTVTTSEFSQNGTLTGTADEVTVTNPKGNLNITSPVMWNLSNLFEFNLNSGGNLNTGNVFGALSVLPVVVNLTAKNTLTLGTANIFVGGFLGGGGKIDINAAKLAYSIPTPAPLLLDASGSMAGGTVDLTLTGATPVTLSSSGAGNIQIIVAPSGGAPTGGGTADINTVGNLTVNLSGLTTNQPAGTLNANVTLQSGGALLITGWNTSVIGTGGTLVASDKTTKAFVVGAPLTSGIVTGGAQITGAKLTISNTGGDVQVGGMDFLNATNQVTVTAGKNIVDVSATEAIFAPTVSLTSNGGSIGLATNPLVLNTMTPGNLNLNAGKGSVFVDDDFAGAITLGTSSGQTFDLQTAQSLVVAGGISGSTVSLAATNGSIIIANSIGNGTGAVTLTAGANGTISQTSGTINATTLSLPLGTMNVNNLQTNVTQLTAPQITGSLTLNNIGSKLLTLTTGGIAAGSGDITITTAGALTQAGTAFAFNVLTYNAAGAITIDGKIAGSASASLNASNGGGVTEGKGGGINASNVVTLTSDTGDINSAKGSLNAPYLVLGTAGNVILTDTLSNGNITVAPITLPVKSFTLNASTDAASTLTLNNVSTSSGSISVVFNGANLTTTSGTMLSTNNGNITLQNTLASTGLLTLAMGTTIHASATTAGLGEVNLLVGPAPKTPTIGNQPANIVEAFSGKGQIFYNNGAAISTAGTNFLNAFGRNIDISGQNANQISLNSVTVTADPPTPGAPTAVTLTTASLVPPKALDGALTQAVPTALSATWEGALVSMPTASFISISQTSWSAFTANPSLVQNGGVSTGLGTSLFSSNSAIDSRQSLQPLPALSVGMSGLSKRGSRQLAPVKGARGPISKLLGDEALLMAPDADTSIESKFGTVELRRNCLALLVSTEKGLTIFNFDDRHSGSVVARIGKQSITLEPGRHLTISKPNVAAYANINPAQFIAHRRMSTGAIGQFKTFKSEFHVLSAISGLKQLREFMGSAQPAKQQTAMHLIKTAAILDGLSQGSPEGFELYSENLVTAMNR